ncbi:Aste57867_6325 [Aphanomyces stellatus]|uniref:Aste57867_6325 protein n=1 Tax=Aphanomyces stellatus TaxID=120398 RepID=A0A485KE45_9STRA|nr:hypothetical protein As57867_006311 [Aphanomyces stellatus]VFT83323.1 Aste57867_6325 [Aphanomyces stellatus]
MYHNTDRMFHQHGFGHPLATVGADFHSHAVLFADHGIIEYVFCRQFASNMDMASYVALTRDHLCTILLVNHLQSRETPTITKSDSISQHQMISHHGDHVNLVCGEFWTADRCVLAIQQIHDDEAWAESREEYRNRTIWIDIHNVPNGIVVRILSLASQKNVTQGQVSVDDEALHWGLDLSDCPAAEKEARFRWHTVDFFNALLPQLNVRRVCADESS